MIVDPDFLEHWRTRMLVDALGGDEMAPFYVLRIWGHCQQRRGDRFAMPAAGLKALCKAAGDAAELETALGDAGFIERDGADIFVPKWAEKNASLLAAWENGNKGGRPRKEPIENPRVTQSKPTANPDKTQTKPIREEKRREEEKEPLVSVCRPAPRPARATRKCPAEFEVTAEMREWARIDAPGVDVDRQSAKFRDHTFKTARTDWLATWKNWIRESFDRLPKQTATGETAWQRSQRERVAEMTGGLLGSKPPARGDIIDMEPTNGPLTALR